MAADGELTLGEMQALLEQESENEIAVQTILNSALDLVGRVRYIQEIIDCYDALVLSRGSEWACPGFCKRRSRQSARKPVWIQRPCRD